MRKLKLQMQMSVDGYMAGNKGELDWMSRNWDDELNEYVTKLTDPVDCILLGRKLAEGFIPFWKSSLEDPKSADHGARKMVNTPKIVFSRTLKNSEWDLTEIAGDDYVNEIKELKEKSGGDIISYGGCTFVSSLIKEDLIDEFYLFVNPVAIGEGMEIFKEKTILKLEEVRQFSCGVALLKYTPANK